MHSILESKDLKVTLNNHHWGVHPTDFQRQLSSQFYLISTNVDEKGKPFVSTMEHKFWPVYGVQWHPEKNNFEMSVGKDGELYEAIEHSYEAVLASQWTANFFVNECRKSPNSFKDWKEAQNRLIYNYQPQRTGFSFIQKYYFDNIVY